MRLGRILVVLFGAAFLLCVPLFCTRVDPGTAVSGVVVLGFGEPVPGAAVTLMVPTGRRSEGRRRGDFALTDSRGCFSLSDLHNRGTVEVRVSKEGFRPFSVVAPYGALSVSVVLASTNGPDQSHGELGESLSADSLKKRCPPGPSYPEETEVWGPAPPVVFPASTMGTAEPPPDAEILFDGTDLDEWVNAKNGLPAAWDLYDGVVTVDKDVGDIQTRRRFGNFQIHIEWRIPEAISGTGQGRGNSGLFLASTDGPGGGYELQILDSFENETYVNGMAGSIYKQSIPLANASRPPGEWQAYDVTWVAPRFNSDGSLNTPARITAFFNGVLVQDNFELQGETMYIGVPRYQTHGESPIRLQSHGDPSQPISFRNIWVRVLE